MSGATYSNPLTITYSLGATNFTTAAAQMIKPPPGCKAGRVEDIHVRVTTAFTQTTSPALVRIGTPTENSKYAELNMGEAAAGVAYNTTDVADSIKANIHIEDDEITGPSLFIVPPTGGTPAGAGLVDVAISWW
jgi:hypothetical protein